MIYMIELRAQGLRRRLSGLPGPNVRLPDFICKAPWQNLLGKESCVQRWRPCGAQLVGERKPRRIAREPRHACARLKHACARRAADSHDDAHGLRSERVSQAHSPAAPQMASSAISRTDGNLPRHAHVAHMRERRQDGGKHAEPARPGFDPPAC